MMNHRSKCVISLNPHDVTNRCEKALLYPIASNLTHPGSEYDIHQLWYIQRDKTTGPNCKITEPNLYTIRSCATSLYLDVGNAAARQRYDGVQPYVTPVQEVYTTQQWRITKQSAEGWTIESRVVGNVLDSSNATKLPLRQVELSEAEVGDILVAKPRTLSQTLQSQMWVIEPVRCSLSSGNNLYLNFDLSVTKHTNFT